MMNFEEELAELHARIARKEKELQDLRQAVDIAMLQACSRERQDGISSQHEPIKEAGNNMHAFL